MNDVKKAYIRALVPVLLLGTSAAWSKTGSNVNLKETNYEAAVAREVNIAPFGRVMTWDPAQAGAQPPRNKEFPAGGIFLGKVLSRSLEGTYAAKRYDDGRQCIGLEWVERRDLKRFVLRFAGAGQMPSSEAVRLEYWHENNHFGSGELDGSPWQGKWVALEFELTAENDLWTFSVDFNKLLDPPDMTDQQKRQARLLPGAAKIRWVFPAGEKPVNLRELAAYSSSTWSVVRLRVERDVSMTPAQGEIEAYNGELMKPHLEDSHLVCRWNWGKPLHLEVLASTPQRLKSDRTILRFRLPGAAFGVAVEDVVSTGEVYLPHAGVYVTSASNKEDLATYRARIADRKHVLERIQTMPDQSFAQAMTARDKYADRSPTMLSLAASNFKLIVGRDGTTEAFRGEWVTGTAPSGFAMIPAFRAGETLDVPQVKYVNVRRNHKQSKNLPSGFRRHLRGGWLPIPTVDAAQAGVTYRQLAFVAPFGRGTGPYRREWAARRSIGVSHIQIENTQNHPERVALKLTFLVEKSSRPPVSSPVSVQKSSQALIVLDGKDSAVVVDKRGMAPLELEMRDNAAVFSGTLPAGAKVSCVAYFPEPDAGNDLQQDPPDPITLLQTTERYWNHLMAAAIQIEIPDEPLMNLIRALPIHCLLASRNEENGERIASWDASDRYGVIDKEAHLIVRAMDWMGHEEFARRSLDFFRSRYSEQGYLTLGYTMTATGRNLTTIAEHYDLTGDRRWLQDAAPTIVRACNWIIGQCARTRRVDDRGEKMPEYGLFPPGVTGDWARFGYRFNTQAHQYAGLREAGRLLGEIRHPDAKRFVQDTAELRQEILRAYRWTQARSPAIALADGTWIPNYPSSLYGFGWMGEVFPRGERAANSYSIEHGAQHMIATGLLDVDNPEADWMVNHFEDVAFFYSAFLSKGYSEKENRADWFNKGGFSKYWWGGNNIVKIYAMRDDVKAVIRSTLNQIPQSLDIENQSLWEHGSGAAWNKTHTAARALACIRLMFVNDRGDELWLAPFVPNNYMDDGEVVVVRHAPTHFGLVNYEICSHVAEGFIEATVDPPTRNAPEQIIMRIRHPEGKLMRSVFVNGEPYRDYNVDREYVRLKPSEKRLKVRVQFGRFR